VKYILLISLLLFACKKEDSAGYKYSVTPVKNIAILENQLNEAARLGWEYAGYIESERLLILRKKAQSP